ncbi:MAG: hypothetical protein ACLQKH_14025 [Steroidobacteraceae bacterium]
MSNLIGAILSAPDFASPGTGTAAGAGFLLITGFAGTELGWLLPAGLAWSLGLGIGLLGFTVTFDVAMGFAFAGGRAAFFGAAALRVAVFGAALPGRRAALFGFFGGLWIFPPPNE